MTHTPGPWIMDAPEIVSGRVVIATIHDTAPISTAQSNARLIAAAPDLLAALREAANFCEASLSGDGTYDPAEETLKEIRAAIAKATGDANGD